MGNRGCGIFVIFKIFCNFVQQFVRRSVDFLRSVIFGAIFRRVDESLELSLSSPYPCTTSSSAEASATFVFFFLLSRLEVTQASYSRLSEVPVQDMESSIAVILSFMVVISSINDSVGVSLALLQFSTPPASSLSRASSSDLF